MSGEDQESFLGKLGLLQKQLSLSDAAIEKAIGKSNLIGRVRRKRLPIPDRETVQAIGAFLQKSGGDITPEALWALAAADKADPEVRAYYEARIAEERADCERRVSVGVSLTSSEGALLNTVRTLQASEDGRAPKGISFDVASWLDEYLKLVQVSARWLADKAPRDDPEPDPERRAARELHSLLYSLFKTTPELPRPLGIHLVRSAAFATGGIYNAFRETNHLRMLAEDRQRDRALGIRDPDREQRYAELLPPEGEEPLMLLLNQSQEDPDASE